MKFHEGVMSLVFALQWFLGLPQMDNTVGLFNIESRYSCYHQEHCISFAWQTQAVRVLMENAKKTSSLVRHLKMGIGKKWLSYCLFRSHSWCSWKVISFVQWSTWLRCRVIHAAQSAWLLNVNYSCTYECELVIKIRRVVCLLQCKVTIDISIKTLSF